MKFNDRLKALGFATYEEYLKSSYWSEFKSKYKVSTCPQVCAVCGEPNYQLHHITYERLGEELLEDVIPLCREHHVKIHQWLKDKKIYTVSKTADAVRFFRREKAPKKPRMSLKVRIFTKSKKGFWLCCGKKAKRDESSCKKCELKYIKGNNNG